MFRVAYSKYKNVTPLLIKKEQNLSGLSTNRLSNTIGSLINCSLDHITFTFDSASGGSLCTVRHDDLPRRATFNSEAFCVVHAHSAPITDIQYNTFNQSVVATCALDSVIKLWSVSNETETTVCKMEPLVNIPLSENRSDCIQWNPNVDGIFASSSLNTVYLWDVNDSQASNIQTICPHSEAIQGLCWKKDGSLICTAAKDKTMCITDPRNINTNQNLKIQNSKTANKDTKVVWLGTSDCVMTSVYTPSFTREIHLWDIRNTSAPVHESSIDSGNNVLNPYYDHDTSALFLVGKAETNIKYGEIFLNDSWTFNHNSSQQIDDQIKGVCLLPKFGLSLMKCEIDRLILLTRNSVYPLPYIAPRNDKTSFHQNLYPDTFNIYEPGCEKINWLKGQNSDALKVPLNLTSQKKIGNFQEKSEDSSVADANPIQVQPIQSKNSIGSVLVSSVNQQSTSHSTPIVTDDDKIVKIDSTHGEDGSSDKENCQKKPENVIIRSAMNQNTQINHKPLAPLSTQSRTSKVKSFYYQSKFKYINGKTANKNEHITNIRGLSSMWSAESNGFQVNTKHAAYFVNGNSGQIGLVQLNKPGRLDDSVNNTIVNKVKCSDFQWDPFDEQTLAAACDDCTIKIWNIPEDGLSESLDEPKINLTGHADRVSSIKYHPYAKNVLASASYDKSIKIWNIDAEQAMITLQQHPDFIFNFNWSPCGTKLATVCKDGFIRVFAPLQSDQPILESKCGPRKDSKAARIEWVLHGRGLLVSGFGSGNLRQIFLFDSETLAELNSEDINHSPSLLIPYFDSDINVVYLYAKGEETIILYEIQEDEPYLQVLTPFKPDGSHLAIGFLPKIACDVKTAEIAKAFRLTKDNKVEPMSFTVPRVKLSFFQDDIFPNTIDRTEAYLSADDWFSGVQAQLNYVNLQPEGMQKLTDMVAMDHASQSSKQKDMIKKVEVKNEKQNGHTALNLNENDGNMITAMLQRASLFHPNKSDDDDDDNSEWD